MNNQFLVPTPDRPDAYDDDINQIYSEIEVIIGTETGRRGFKKHHTHATISREEETKDTSTSVMTEVINPSKELKAALDLAEGALDRVDLNTLKDITRAEHQSLSVPASAEVMRYAAAPEAETVEKGGYAALPAKAEAIVSPIELLKHNTAEVIAARQAAIGTAVRSDYGRAA